MACALVALLVAPSLAHAQEAPMTLETLERMALGASPAIAQAAAAADVARGEARQAGMLPNPTIGYTSAEVSPGEVTRGGEHGVFVEQTIPLGGKLALSRRVFGQEVQRAERLGDVERQRLLNTVRALYYDALGAARRIETRDRLAQLATEAVAVTRQLVNTGVADQPDILGAEIEARRAQLALEQARNEQFRVWRRLALVTGDATLAPRPLAGSFDAALPELERDVIVARVLRESPELNAARAGLARSDAALGRASRETRPDLFLRGGALYNRERLETGQRPVGWEAEVEAGVSVPLFNRNQGGIAAAQAGVSRARAEVRRLELDVQGRVADQFAEYLTALREADVYRTDILPRAEQSYRAYLAKYREMAAAYPQVLASQRTLFEVTEQYERAVVRTWRAAVSLQGYVIDDEAGARDGESATAAMEPRRHD